MQAMGKAREKLLLMKMQLRTVLQNAGDWEATRVVDAQGRSNDFLSHLFIPDTVSPSVVLRARWEAPVWVPLCGWVSLEAGHPLPAYLLRYTRFSVNCPLPW